MKILYIHQYFKTPYDGGAIRSYYIAQGMVEEGHRVEIITAHNERNYVIKEIDGFTVHYLPIKYNNHYSFFRRLYSFLLFAHKAYYLGRTFKNIDLAYVTSTPLTVGLTALKLKRKDHIPYIFEVRDLWPEAPIQIGAIKSKFFKYVTRKLELAIYKNANKIIALSPGISDHITRRVPGKTIHFCPNISDCSFFEMTNIKDQSLLENHKLGNAFVISYFGAIGKVNALEFLLDLARISGKEGLNIKFLLIGDGAKVDSLKEIVKKENLENLEFIPHMNKFKLKEYLSVSDAAYISFAKFPVLEHNSPNKFFDAIASGKLVISNTQGWIKTLIENNECGFYVDPNKPYQFLEMVKPFLNSTQLKKYQFNSRLLAESTFEKKLLIKDLLGFIKH